MSELPSVKQGTAIDLFCGAGGLSAGFEQAGFRILVGNDMMAAAGETFEATHPNAKFLLGEIQKFDASDFLAAAGLKPGELHCLIGGPPCQGFSVYNHNRGLDDDRSKLFHEYMRIVEGIRPAWVVLENVTGILSAGGGAAADAIIESFEGLGYKVEMNILKAEEYGVPQERRRVIFMGNRVGAPIVWPARTHGPAGSGLPPFVTIADAIGDLPILENGEDLGAQPYRTPPRNEFQLRLRGNAQYVANHAAPRLGSVNVQRLAHIPPGGSWRDIPFDLLPLGMKRAKRSDHTKRYGRLRWDGLSSTILTKCDIHWGAYIHPEQDRALSVREAARLQSFPDSFHFAGSKTEQYVQVGNAVPPLLGLILGETIIKSGLSEKKELFCTAAHAAA